MGAALDGEGVEPGGGPAGKWDVPRGLLNVFLGLVLIYSAMFATGFWLYSNTVPAVITSVTAVVSALLMRMAWRDS